MGRKHGLGILIRQDTRYTTNSRTKFDEATSSDLKRVMKRTLACASRTSIARESSQEPLI